MPTAWRLPLLASDPLHAEKQAWLARAGLRTEQPAASQLDAAEALRRCWLPCARVLCLNETEAYFLEDDADLQAELSPRNEAAALALLLDTLRSAEGALRCVLHSAHRA